MTRTVKGDNETRELVTQETTVKALDKTTVQGTATLLADVIQQVATGDYAIAAGGKYLASIRGNVETEIDGRQVSR